MMPERSLYARSANESGATGRQFTVTQLAGKDALAPHWDSIADLAARAIEPNPFYEPWMLSGVLDVVVNSGDLLFFLVFKTESSSGASKLCGFFPVMQRTRHHALPLRSLRLLAHDYSFLGVPIVDRGMAAEVLLHFLSECRSSGASLVEFPLIPVGGGFHQALVDILYQQRFASRIERRYLRALYQVPDSPSGHPAPALSGETRRQLRRRRERLAEIGAVEYSTLERADAPEVWLREFLELEAGGWKGTEKTALASSAAHAEFFVEASMRALARDAVFGSALRLDGRMIAGRIVYRSGEGSCLFKLAYDEQYAAFSPGTILELETMVHGVPEGVRWTDSGTSASSTHYRRLWSHTRTIEHLVVSPASHWGDLAIGLVPVMRWIKEQVGRAGGRRAGRANHAQEGDSA